MHALARRLADPDPRRVAWAAAALAALAGWAGLIAAAPGARLGWEAFLALCATPGAAAPSLSAYPAVATMWLLMAAAMMAPAAAPAAGVYAGLVSRDPEAGPAPRVAAFLGGYLAVWGGFALAAAGLQIALARAGSGVDPQLTGAALLGAAGLWQLSALKAACLATCRNPITFFLGHWREGPSGAFALGVRHGLVCLGCCWALMLLMLGFGAMNLLWMAALGLGMMAEKLAPGAERLARPLGAAALAGAGALALSAL